MRLVWCMFVVRVVNCARVSNDVYYNIAKDRTNVALVPVPGAVYHVPSPLAAPPRTPASTVLLPMLGQSPSADDDGVARNEGEVFKASPKGNIFDGCVWLLRQCTSKERRRRSLTATGVTPAFLRYGYGLVPNVQYPVHVSAQPGVPTTYGAQFWCGIFAMKCLPNIG